MLDSLDSRYYLELFRRFQNVLIEEKYPIKIKGSIPNIDELSEKLVNQVKIFHEILKTKYVEVEKV